MLQGSVVPICNEQFLLDAFPNAIYDSCHLGLSGNCTWIVQMMIYYLNH